VVLLKTTDGWSMSDASRLAFARLVCADVGSVERAFASSSSMTFNRVCVVLTGFAVAMIWKLDAS
jgi:hypothetical protein